MYIQTCLLVWFFNVEVYLPPPETWRAINVVSTLLNIFDCLHQKALRPPNCKKERKRNLFKAYKILRQRKGAVSVRLLTELRFPFLTSDKPQLLSAKLPQVKAGKPLYVIRVR